MHELAAEALGSTSSDAPPPDSQVGASNRGGRVEQDSISGDDSEDTLDSRVERARNALEALSTRPPSDYDAFQVRCLGHSRIPNLTSIAQAILAQINAVLVDYRVALAEREPMRRAISSCSALTEAVENEKRLLNRLVEVKQRLIRESEESGRLKEEALAACRDRLEAETEKANFASTHLRVTIADILHSPHCWPRKRIYCSCKSKI